MSRCIFRGDRCNLALWEFLPDQERRLHDDPWLEQMHEDYPQVLTDNLGNVLNCISSIQPHEAVCSCCFQSSCVEQLVGMAYARAWFDICKSFVAASSAAAGIILGFNLETASVCSLGAKQIASKLHLGIHTAHAETCTCGGNQLCVVIICTKNSVPQMRLTHKHFRYHRCNLFTSSGLVLSFRSVSHLSHLRIA